jgi:hypothetical protein
VEGSGTGVKLSDTVERPSKPTEKLPPLRRVENQESRLTLKAAGLKPVTASSVVKSV